MSTVIRHTFLHLPAVGPSLERRLWKAGFQDWDGLWQALTSGRSARECTRVSQQRELFNEPTGKDELNNDKLTIQWIDRLDESRSALEMARYEYFLEQLRPSAHWRLLPAVIDRALFLDIETTGLSREHHYVTVIGAQYEGVFHQWTWPQSVARFSELLEEASAVITFNGSRFDIPFLNRQLPLLGRRKAHIDLRQVAHAAGMRGGQKEIEKKCGLRRGIDIAEYDGEKAVFSWCAALYGNTKEYDRLLRYNRADVEALPRLASHLYEILSNEIPLSVESSLAVKGRTKAGMRAATHVDLCEEWRRRMPSYSQLREKLTAKGIHSPVVVGIDLRGNELRPTGWAVCHEDTAKTTILHSDQEILSRTLSVKPDLVSIDAPLSLPRGRTSVSDDSPCRKLGGIVRDAERILWSRHIRVYPALIKQMQRLTARGIALAKELELHGIRVIESYPGAAQDVLNIPRKKDDQTLLEEGLRQFGYEFASGLSHDELDAITSALVGHFYLAGSFEAIGADDEGYMINPRIANMRWRESGPAQTEVFF